MRSRLTTVLWILLAAPGLYQVGLLVTTVALRFTYPYDLEWMEGGLLTHALRFQRGHDIYGPPSIDFIPYLYTPLYPALLAGLGKVVGLSYQLGRAVSFVSMLAVFAVAALAILRETWEHPTYGPQSWVGTALAAGFFAAAYPWTEGWYDLVRADTLALALALLGLLALRAWGPIRSQRLRGFWHGRVAVAAALLALAFFAKQTSVLLVAAGGLALLVMNGRATATYAVVAGAIGGGGSLLLNWISDGWYWTYVFRYHQQHESNWYEAGSACHRRFVDSFGNIFSHFPALSGAVALALLLVLVVTAVRRRLPPCGAGLLYWTWLFAVGVFAGALGWSTPWARFNAYIPAMTLGAIAAGAAVPALAGALDLLLAGGHVADRTRVGVTLAVAAALAAQLVLARWEPRPFVPTRADREAGDRLVRRLEAVPGEIFIPFHPWYAHLAGKRTFTHEMGIRDVTTFAPDPRRGKKPLPARARQVAGLAEAVQKARFAAIVLDDHPNLAEYALDATYRLDATLGRDDAPRVFSGAQTFPRSIYVPRRAEPLPEGWKALWDFEAGSFDGWTAEGTAWGKAPVQRAIGKQGLVGGYRGAWFVGSAHEGDAATGTLLSPELTLAGPKLAFRVGGGRDDERLRVELRRSDGQAVRSATGPGAELMQRIEWDVHELVGEKLRFALVDASSEPMGHLTVDELWEAVGPPP